MSDEFQGGPPLLTEVIESGLQEIEASTQSRPGDPQVEILRAQLPELFEKALLRVKPQLMAEFEKIVREALGK
ncbi:MULTISPECIES: hypothetical protein [Limnobacter]|uniref:DNA polymerase III subunit chi n=1 Tax=Limnobacter litoralis TaxID=481366 RepID=A0ABQ5YQK7_9BURK|nr:MULTISPECIES: hypothetical protein [Limnobacter]GLR26191.1 hypothetical protein GCM10007875_12790 [Limnobacter litoralis]HEX5485350.1 hypothetical protein [Limnobacter sp.]